MNKITIVIPCYNESDSLPELIRQLKKVSLDFNFILVDNGSTDNTENILKKIKFPKNIQVLKKDTNNGYGAGIKYGLSSVKTEFSGWMHADLQQEASSVLFNAKLLLEVIDSSKKNSSYAVKGIRSGRSIYEKFFTFGVSLFSSILFFRKFWDIAGQPNIFKTSSLKFLNKAPDGHAFEFFVYIHFLMRGGIYKRFNAPFLKRKFGSSSWDKGFKSKLKHTKYIFKYILNLRSKY